MIGRFGAQVAGERHKGFDSADSECLDRNKKAPTEVEIIKDVKNVDSDKNLMRSENSKKDNKIRNYQFNENLRNNLNARDNLYPSPRCLP